MEFEGHLKELKDSLKQLPGVGEKSAQRMAFFLITTDKKNALGIAEKIKYAVSSIKRCDMCNMLSEESPCHFCRNQDRDDNVLCIVEKTKDVYLIENTGKFNGRYISKGSGKIGHFFELSTYSICYGIPAITHHDTPYTA